MNHWLETVFRMLIGFGPIGIFFLALLDSTIFFFVPFALDALLIILISRHRSWMPLYATIALAGSLIGVVITYFIVRNMSDSALEKILPKKKLQTLRKKIKEKGFGTILITALLPPPFPFTPFVVAAAVTKFPQKKLVSAVASGRVIRYFLLGFLALLFGKQILVLLESHIFQAVMIGIFAIAMIGTIISVIRWLTRR
jgi:membrane protein YqaA with SNARE-associated domain